MNGHGVINICLSPGPYGNLNSTCDNVQGIVHCKVLAAKCNVSLEQAFKSTCRVQNVHFVCVAIVHQ